MTDAKQYTVTRADLPEVPAAVVSGTVSHTGIADFVGAAFGEVLNAIESQGIAPAGPPFGRYQSTQDGGWEIQAGFPTSAPITGAGRVTPDTLPGGHVARVIHQGAYDELGAAYEAAETWIIENGLHVRGAAWESYLDGPDVAEPRTQVFLPFAEADTAP